MQAEPGRVDEAQVQLGIAEEDGLAELLDQLTEAQLAVVQGHAGLLELAEVDVQAVHLRLVLPVAQQQVRGVHPDQAAILALERQFAGRDWRATIHPALDIAGHRLLHRFGDDQFFQAPAQCLGQAVAVKALAGGVPENDPALTVVGLHGDTWSLLQQAAEALLAFAQSLLIQTLAGDIAQGAVQMAIGCAALGADLQPLTGLRRGRAVELQVQVEAVLLLVQAGDQRPLQAAAVCRADQDQQLFERRVRSAAEQA